MKIKFKDVASMNEYKYNGQENNKFLPSVVGMRIFDVTEVNFSGQKFWMTQGGIGTDFVIHVESESRFFEIV